MHFAVPLVMIKVSFDSGETCLRSLAGMLILPLLSIEYVNCPLNISIILWLFSPQFPTTPQNNRKILQKSRKICSFLHKIFYLIGWKNSPNIKIVAKLIYNDRKLEIIEGMPCK